MKQISLFLPEPYIRALDRLVNDKYYPNRSEAIRAAVRELVRSESHLLKRSTAEVGRE